jgi:hypothetical protein
MSKSERLYNLDLAPTPKDKKTGVGLKYLTCGQMTFKVFLATRLRLRCFYIPD